MVTENRLVETINEKTAIVYTAFKGVWPVAPRDMCQVSTFQEIPENLLVIASCSVNHPNVPVKEGHVRAVLFAGGFQIEKWDEARAKITFVAHMDLQGTKHFMST